MVSIHTIGGYSEVGKNMTILDLGEDAIMLDAGLFLPPIVELEEKEKVYNEATLRNIRAIPDDLALDSLGLRKKIRAILIGHAHLDHVGAVPYLAGRYDADIVGAPFTIEVLKRILEDEDTRLKNPIKSIQPNSSFVVKGKKEYLVEFLNITHSTLQTSLIVVHTDEGAIVYANDFKLDNNPIVGKAPNYEAIKRIAKQGVKALIVDSLYSGDDKKTPSEKIARGLLEDVMLTTSNEKSGMVITTFSSHIARLKSIVDFSKELDREVIFVGRSLAKYTAAAIKVGLCPFEKDIRLSSYKKQMEKTLQKVDKNRKDYVVVCTGHQGEPGSILDRMARDKLPLRLHTNDHVIFSSRTIPTPASIANREQLERKLKGKQVRIFDSVHVSGHAGREDLRDFIGMLSPQHIIPAHGGLDKTTPMAELASELGYKLNKQCHLMQDGQMLKI